MLKKSVAFILSFFLIFNIFCIPAFAADDDVPPILDIAKDDKGLTISNYIIVVGDSDYYLLNTSSPDYVTVTNMINPKISIYKSTSLVSIYCYTIPMSNPYGEWTKSGGTMATLSFTGYIAWSNYDLYNGDDIVFQANPFENSASTPNTYFTLKSIDSNLSNVTNAVLQIKNTIESSTTSIVSAINNVDTNIDDIVTQLTTISNSLDKSKANTLGYYVYQMYLDLQNVKSTLLNVKAYLVWIYNQTSDIRGYVYSIKNSFLNFLDTFWLNMNSAHGNDWANFWESFNDLSLHDFIVNTFNEIYTTIQDEVNPLTENNQDNYYATVDSFYTDTFIGSLRTLGTETVPTIVDSLSGQNAKWSFTTAAVKNSYYSLPAHTITLDLSWYLNYKSYGDMVISGFLWLGYIWLLFKRAPAIIHGEAMVADNINTMFDSPQETTMETTNITLDSAGNEIFKSTSTTVKDTNGNKTITRQVQK